MSKKTKWFVGVNPVRDGVYQRSFGAEIYWGRFFNGKWRFSYAINNFDSAAKERGVSPIQNVKWVKWRGMAAPK